MAGTGLDRLSVLPSGLANQRYNMSRIGIAMSGGPNSAEIIDLVVLAERLGYESTWVAEGLAATSAACLAACAMRTSRILGSGPCSFSRPSRS
jgi:alkanesulfonate monooxygenase SsuD/methylene tetrahydromethanopterin reductase-like flavin-dependent oxidoreductase (luciferase family)